MRGESEDEEEDPYVAEAPIIRTRLQIFLLFSSLVFTKDNSLGHRSQKHIVDFVFSMVRSL